mmetsp:Transcript_14454/g.58525  ORF Transcript_14454/g.58525 Transcript_14454/m.58525 type:complete len:87 (-) Transcript_14454:4787-5047(-)
MNTADDDDLSENGEPRSPQEGQRRLSKITGCSRAGLVLPSYLSSRPINGLQTQRFALHTGLLFLSMIPRRNPGEGMLCSLFAVYSR